MLSLAQDLLGPIGIPLKRGISSDKPSSDGAGLSLERLQESRSQLRDMNVDFPVPISGGLN